MYDLPATVRKVVSVTQSQSLAYVAFSQGTEIAFAQLSRDPELARQIKIFVALAPVAYTDGIKSPIRLLAPFADDIAVSVRFLQNVVMTYHMLLLSMASHIDRYFQIEIHLTGYP